MAAATLGFVVGAGLVVMPPSFAATSCDDAVTPIAAGSTVSGNVTVPTGKTCDLSSVTVTGGITVQADAILRVLGSGNHVGSNVSSNSANEIRLTNATVGGNVTLTGTHTQLSFVCGSQISGGLTVTQSTVSFTIGGHTGITCSLGNSVGGSITFNNNSTADVSDNKIGNALYCSGNAPPPTGSGNTAGSGTGPNHNGLNGQCSTFS
jgi:hypothetical protein